MSSPDKYENGSAVMVIGWVLILFAFLVMFFRPAGIKLGKARFDILAAGLAAPGVVLGLIGGQIRARNR